MVSVVHQMKLYSQSQKTKFHGMCGVWCDPTMPRYNCTFQLMKFKSADHRTSGCFIIAQDNAL